MSQFVKIEICSDVLLWKEKVECFLPGGNIRIRYYVCSYH